MSQATFRAVLAAAVAGAASCSPSSLVDVPGPSTLVPVSSVTTPDGAAQLYAFAITQFAISVGGGDGTTVGVDSYVSASGLLTDELMRTGTRLTPPFLPTITVPIDERTMYTSAPSGSASLYDQLQRSRVEAQQAREALSRYAPAAPTEWRGELYATEAYSIVMFSELFCSGIPLSTVPLVGAPVPSRGYSTGELLETAEALFDSALTYRGQSSQVLNLALVGKARTLLDRGLSFMPTARSEVQSVPTDFVYNAQFNASVPRASNWIASNTAIYQVTSGEGGNGLAWRTDPRPGVESAPGIGFNLPAKYSRSANGILEPGIPEPNMPIPVASGVEARLIEAESALYTGDSTWLDVLNSLRATCVASASCAPVPRIVPGALPPLRDPGVFVDPNARIKLLMKERAMWLFLTGHRQGDLRRLARWYGLDPATLWPSGAYSNPASAGLFAAPPTDNTAYGTNVVLGPDPQERITNPLYVGCLHISP